MTLTDRYIATTLRRIPTDKRDDIDRELRGSIADAVDARIDSGIDPVAAETEVLTELGDPDRLAAEYAGRPLYLIGPELYLGWRRLLAVLLWIAPIPGVVVLALDVIEGGAVGSAIASGIWVTAIVAVQIVFWTTLVFAVLERNGHRQRDLAGEWTVERLPDTVGDRQIRLSDTVWAVAFQIFVIAAVILQRDFTAYQDADGSTIPILDPELWSFWIPVLLALTALGAVLEIVKYAVGHWTVSLAAAVTVVSVLFTVPLVWLGSTDRLFEPAYFEAAFGATTEPMRVANVVVIVVALGVAAWEIGEGWWKLLRTR
ncbi:permease prefix domain 1-containing protein [Rhodococcus sp. NPDC060086]|uniref:permease prefix domain 1-containing protein n=1 Tax=unclassified Rhodococcus (in: high G+C Gram-positive bacteria) TaxID=192944 RepID=UPI003646F895